MAVSAIKRKRTLNEGLSSTKQRGWMKTNGEFDPIFIFSTGKSFVIDMKEQSHRKTTQLPKPSDVDVDLHHHHPKQYHVQKRSWECKYRSSLENAISQCPFSTLPISSGPSLSQGQSTKSERASMQDWLYIQIAHGLCVRGRSKRENKEGQGTFSLFMCGHLLSTAF